MINHERLQFIVLTLIFGVLGLAISLIWWPFLKILAVAGMLAVLFWPVYTYFENKMENGVMSALATIILLMLIMLVPLFIFGQLVFAEVSDLYFRVKDASVNQQEIINKLPLQLQGYGQEFLIDLGNKVGEFAGRLVQSVGYAVSSTAGFFLNLFLMFFAFYYFLRDGKKIKSFANTILPMSEAKENILVEKLSLAISGVVKGSFLVALIQGVVATIGFLIFGVPNPFLWGMFTVLAALVPNVGTSLSMIPAIILLFLTDKTSGAIGLSIWAILAVGLIDNVLSPKLVGAQTKLHPILVLFSVLGGIQLFGFIGFLLGPILMAMFVALLEIYRVDIKKYLEK